MGYRISYSDNYKDNGTPVIVNQQTTAYKKLATTYTSVGSGENSYSDNGMTLLGTKEVNIVSGTTETNNRGTSTIVKGLYVPYGYDSNIVKVVTQKSQEIIAQSKVDDAQTAQIQQIQTTQSAQVVTDTAQDTRIEQNKNDIEELKKGVIDIKEIGTDAGEF